MQKIIKQDLGNSEEIANSIAEYTWAEDEIAWLFDSTWRDVFKVQFTGKHWLSGNKWGRDKIYQYRFLDSSGEHDLKRKGLDNDGISHDDEDDFYTTKEEALSRGIRHISNKLQSSVDEHIEDLKRLQDFNNKLDI